MKKNLLIISFGIFALIANAQITVTSSDFPSLGTSFVDANDTMPINVSVGSAGANITWNLTSLQNENADTTSFISKNGTACESDFTNSGMAFTGVDGIGYGSVNPSGLDIDGFCQDGGGGYVPIVFNPSWRLISFPSTYQTSFNSSTGFELKMFYGQNGIDSIKIVHSSAINSVIDGYGTVTTPALSNVNCLRQKYTEFSDDNTYGKGTATGGQWISFSASKDTSITYRWVTNSPSNFFAAEIKTNYAGDTVESANYLLSTFVGIKENTDAKSNISVFPNPASETLFINGITGVSYVLIFDMTGKLMECSLLKKSNSAINVSNYENGIYFYQLVDISGNVLSKGKFAVTK